MLACPNQCIYCNQRIISGQQFLPTEMSIISTIESRLFTIPKEDKVELGFFGGTFTALPLQEQERLLRLVQPYLDKGVIQSIRLSTRPDYIDESILELLGRYGVRTIELGVQSLDDEVLQRVQRGYTYNTVCKAAAMIKDAHFSLGMQMMVGLPGDTPQRSMQTARRIITLGADNTRIYPTLVIANTVLSAQYHSGDYVPLSVDEAVRWVAPVLRLFVDSGVAVLRVGLHPTEGFITGEDYEAGPFHVAFRQLVDTYIWRQQLELIIHTLSVKKDAAEKVALRDTGTQPDTLSLWVSPAMLGSIAGYHSSNRKWLVDTMAQITGVDRRRVRIHLYPDERLHGYTYRYSFSHHSLQ